MPAIDRCEPQVIRALEKEGWVVEAHHYLIRISTKKNAFADLRLRKATNHLLIAEVKCFASRVLRLDEAYHTIGQYQVYRKALQLSKIVDPLYLAIPSPAYARLIAEPPVYATMQEAMIKLILIDLEREAIERWIH